MKVKDYFKKFIAKVLTVTLVAGAMVTGLPAQQAEAASRFKDIAKHWGETAITSAADMGMVKGDDKGKYNPDANITRAEFISIINNTLGTTAMADISMFTDASSKKWHYNNLRMAYFIGTIWGKSEDKLMPDTPITREDAFIGIARILELSSDNVSVLSKFEDGNKVSENGKKSMAALVSAGYVNGSATTTGKAQQLWLKPDTNLTRAEVAAVFTNIISEIYVSTKNYSGWATDKCIVVNKAGAEINGLTVNGDLIIGDGVGKTGVTIQNSTIKGRLVIRGGGENSIHLENTKVTGGVFVNSPSTPVHIYAEAGTSLGIVTAKTSTTMDGDGFDSLQIPSSAAENSTFNVWNAPLVDSVDIDAQNCVLNLSANAGVTNVRFGPNAKDSALTVAGSSTISFLGVGAPNITVTGSGDIEDAQINADGFKSSIKPDTYSIANNISATLGGKKYSGESFSGSSQNQVTRTTSELYVSVETDSSSSISAITVASSSSNTAYLTAKGSTRIPLTIGDTDEDDTYYRDFNNRYAYWVEVLVPHPNISSSSGRKNQYATVTHNMDGEMRSYSYGVVNGYMHLHIPVTKDAGEAKGNISQRVYIDWDNTSSSKSKEVLDIKASSIPIKELLPTEEARLIDQFNQAIFKGCDDTTYTGSEAIKRLLNTDNPLGLALRAFKSFPESEKNALAVKLFTLKDQFKSKADIQKQLVSETGRKGALYSLNKAMSAEEVQAILEDPIYAEELGIDTGDDSKYASISMAGRTNVAKAILTARKADFADAKAVKTAFDKALDTVMKNESTFLLALNAATTAANAQKVYENKANTAIMNISLDADPYISFTTAHKTSIATDIYSNLPFSSVDDVRAMLVTLIGADVSEDEDTVVTAVVAESKSITLALGSELQVSSVVKLTKGKTAVDEAGTENNTTWSSDAPAVASVDSDGTILGSKEGTAKVTVASKRDNKKTAVVSVKVIKPIYATGITLSHELIEMEEGSKAMIVAAMAPTNSTDTVSWRIEDTTVAEIDSMGRITTKGTGYTNISARTTSGKVATCELVVLSADEGMVLNKEYIEIGKGGKYTLKAYVSPISMANRKVIWQNDLENPGIVEVGGTGLIVGKEFGNAVITAKAQGKTSIEGSAVVVVDPLKDSVVLDKTEVTMYTNGKDYLTADLTSQLGTDVSWSIESTVDGLLTYQHNPDEENGIIVKSSGKTGTALVTVTSAQDSTASETCVVTVKDKLTAKLDVSNGTYSINNTSGEAIAMNIVFGPTEPTNKKITWTGPEGIVEISDDNRTVTLLRGYDQSAFTKGVKTVIFTGMPETGTMGTPIKLTINIIDKPVELITVNATGTIDVTVGDTIYLKDYFVAKPDSATNKRMYFVSNAPSDLMIYDSGGDNPYMIANRSSTRTVTVSSITPTVPAVYDASGQAITVTVPAFESVSTETVDTPFTVTATPVNGKDGVKASISVKAYPNTGSDDIKNINIQMNSRWVYQLGEVGQKLQAVFNLDEQTKVKGADPADTKMIWTSEYPDIVSINRGTGEMTFHKAGKSTIYVKASGNEDIQDSRTVIVYPKSLQGVSSIGASPNAVDNVGYGRVISLNMNDKRTTTLTPVFAGEKHDYNYVTVDVDEDKNEKGTSSVVSIDQSTGKVTANKIGMAKIILRESGEQWVVKQTTLREALADQSVNLNLSGIKVTGSGEEAVYTSPNRKYAAGVSKDFEVLDLDTPYYLVVEDSIEPYPVFVWVAPAQLSTVSLVTDSGSQASASVVQGSAIKLRAVLNPATASISEASIVWNAPSWVSITNKKAVKNSDGSYTITADASGTSVGAATITVSMQSVEGLGFYSTDNYRNRQGENGAGEAVERTSANFTLTVTPIPVTSLTVKAPTETPYLGESYNLAVTGGIVITPTNAGILEGIDTTSEGALATKITWSSSNESVVKVDKNGVLTYDDTTTGTATITAKIATVPGGSTYITTSFAITCAGQRPLQGARAPSINNSADTLSGDGVFISIMSMAVTPVSDEQQIDTSASNVPNDLGETGLLMVVANADAAAAPTIGTGEVLPTPTVLSSARAVKSLTTTSSGTRVSTSPAVTAITIRSAVTVIEGNIVQLMPVVTPVLSDTSTITWSSANNSIATVDQNGIVTGITPGKSVRITAKLPSGRSAISTVKVVRAPIEANQVNSITMSKATLTLQIGDASSLAVAYNPTMASIKGASWYSSDSTILTVDQSGRLKALKAGEVIVTAVADDGGKTAECRVTVVPKITAIKASVASTSMKIGQKQTATFTITPTGAANVPVTWTTSNANVLTVNANGEITAVKAGAAYIYVTSSVGGKRSSVYIRVTK